MSRHVYTHRDLGGLRWRFDGARPVSELTDRVMDIAPMPKPKPKRKAKKKKVK